MPDLSLNELIDTEVMRSKGQYFRNREIVVATGASRAHVSQRLKFLWDEGVIEKHGIEWCVQDQAKLVTLLLKKSRALELNSSKLIRTPALTLEKLVEAIQFLNSTRSEWEAEALLLENDLLEEVDIAMETLRNFKKLLQKPTKSDKQIFMHVVNSGKYAKELEDVFVQGVKHFRAIELDNEKVITDTIRPEIVERYGLE